MTNSYTKYYGRPWIQIIAALIVVISFFLPWVSWQGTGVSGMAMATGDFFRISEQRFELANPFPQLSFLFFAFWLIPVLGSAIIFLSFTKQRSVVLAYICGATSLGLVTIYILFTGILVDLGAGKSVIGMLKPSIYLHAFGAILLIIAAFPVKQQAWKLGWLLLGPVIAFAGFKIGEKQVMGQTHKETKDVKADYSTSATELLKEFAASDSSANRKYLDKMVEVKGRGAVTELLEDSTSTLKFADSTGSYLIFSFEKDQMSKVQLIKPETEVTVKGVCSGSIFSEILGTRSISFKRSTINK